MLFAMHKLTVGAVLARMHASVTSTAMPGLLLGGPPPRTPPRRAAVAIMCDSHEPLMSNVSAPVFLEELDRPGGALDGQSARFTVAQPGCCASKEEAA